MRLKDMNYLLTTYQPIRLHYPSGESNIATIYDFENYKQYKVVSIWCRDNTLNIELKEPEFGEYSHLNVLEYLINNYPEEIVDLYCKGRKLNIDSYENLECVLMDNNISTDTLKKYKNNMSQEDEND